MLSKNLDALKQIQPKLVQQIEETTINDKVVLFAGSNGDINIAYEDIALHNINDPIGESLEIFENDIPEIARNRQSSTFIYGLGLGYLLRRTFINTEGAIIVYEPYPEVLKQTLEIVDFSSEFASGRVSIATKISDIVPLMGKTYMMGDNFKTIALNSYRNKEPELFIKVLDEIKSGMYVNVVGQNTMLKMMEDFTESSLNNISRFLKYPDAAITHNMFENMPGVVVSAGPSLDRPGVMETLAKYRKNLVVACVGQAAKALDKAGIVPDFVNVIEFKNVSQQLEGVSFVKDTTMFLLPQTNATLYELPAKHFIIAHPSQDYITTWLSQALDKQIFGYNHQGTVSITALITLIKMGCNPIFLLGQDLAYPEGKMYAHNSVYKGCHLTTNEKGEQLVEMDNHEEFYSYEGFYKNKEEWAIFQRKTAKQVVKTKGWNGENLDTSISYDAFRKAFEGIANQVPSCKFINCSEGGAYIEGFEHMPLSEAVEKMNVNQFDPTPNMEILFKERYYEESPYSESFQKVYNRYCHDIEELAFLENLVQEGISQVKRLINETKNKKVLTHSLTSRLKKLTQMDNELAQYTKQNFLINCYIKNAMMKFSREYGRKLQFETDHNPEGDMKELMENLENTLLMYEAIDSGVKKLINQLNNAFQEFPAHKDSTTKLSSDSQALSCKI